MTEMSRAGVRAGCIPGPPTSSSPAAPVGAPGGAPSAPALDTPRRCWRPMNVDDRDDVRILPDIHNHETVTVNESVL